MNDRSFRIALVGCGRISKNHFDSIRRVEGLSLSAVCDIDAERARAAGEELGVPSFVSYDEMLRESACDVVTICTPSGLHASQGSAAAAAKKHVVTEKPMAISLRQADDLVRACDQAGVQLFVVKQNRLNPPIQLLKRAVDKAMDSGKPTIINAAIDPAAGSESGRIGNLNPQSVVKKK